MTSIVEPGPAGPELATQFGVPLYQPLAELFAQDTPNGVILATPNQLHVDGALACVCGRRTGARGEADRRHRRGRHAAGRGRREGRRARAHGSPPAAQPDHDKAREIVASGVLGPIVAVGTALFYKPDDYYDVGGGWRREPGGGPILLNLIHEVNNLQSLVGDIVSVQAVTSNATRGFPVEDTAAMVFRFAGGALGTFLLSDTAASARSWEQTSRENTAYSTYEGEDAYHIAGTTGSLSVPTMRLEVFRGKRSWNEPYETSSASFERTDPPGQPGGALRAAVIRGDARPIVSGRDGLTTLRVVDAVAEAARTGRIVGTTD